MLLLCSSLAGETLRVYSSKHTTTMFNSIALQTKTQSLDASGVVGASAIIILFFILSKTNHIPTIWTK